MMENKKNVKAETPGLLKMWCNISRSLPRVCLPIGPHGSSLNFSVSIATILLLGSFNILMERLLVNHFGFPANKKVTKVTTASLVAIFHSSNLVVALGYLFATHSYQPTAKMSQAPMWWQEACHAVLQFCTGYMIYDSLVMVVAGVESSDYLFLGHHLATILYMTSTRMVGAGHFSAMICMFTGEFTNPFHNGYYIAQNALSLDCCNGPWMQHFDYVNTFLFCLTYCIFRTFVCPGYGIHVLYDTFCNGRKNGIPAALLVFWNFLIWGVLLGSIPWIQDCWNMLQKYFPHSEAATVEL